MLIYPDVYCYALIVNDAILHVILVKQDNTCYILIILTFIHMSIENLKLARKMTRRNQLDPGLLFIGPSQIQLIRIIIDIP